MTIFNETDIPSVIALLPTTFGLRGFPGDDFRVTTGYLSGSTAKLVVETLSKRSGEWVDFTTATYAELTAELTT